MDKIAFGNLKEQSNNVRESLRAIRANLQFCGDDVKVILFTSSMPDEGKSTVAFNLARSLTESGKKILFIDTDMRKSVLIGRLRVTFNQSNKKHIVGLSHYLVGQRRMGEIVYDTNVENLNIVFSGTIVPNPTEILESHYMKELLVWAKANYDYVILDCAPIGAAIDAAVIAPYCDGAVLVIAQGQVSSRVIQSVIQQLKNSGVRILGAVINKVKMPKKGYNKYIGGYYGSYYGDYYISPDSTGE